MNQDYIYKKLKIRKRSRFPEDINEIFGFKNDSYYLNTPISESKLLSFENYFSIKFPEEYRMFISKIGNGGADPAYGFLSLEMSLTRLIRRDMYDETLGISLDNYLATPFQIPKDKDWNTPGMLPICYFGCSRYDFLIISGKERGHIWTWVEDVGFFPKEPPDYNKRTLNLYTDKWLSGLLSLKNKYRMGFNTWYQLWLDETQ